MQAGGAKGGRGQRIGGERQRGAAARGARQQPALLWVPRAEEQPAEGRRGGGD
jgi:hypothetical protein